MKINEPLTDPLEYDSSDAARRLEVEILAEMKSDFQDFMTSTRERLRSIAKSLVELDAEISAAPQATDEPFEHPMDRAVRGDHESVSDRSVQHFGNAHLRENGRPVQAVNEQASPLPWPRLTPELIRSQSAIADKSDIWPERIPDSDEPAAWNRNASDDASSDPMERLNAIKQRLARQIENS